jgi:asparagine synthase (glutamine-hydrolysing)
MCGICGTIRFDKKPIDEVVLKKMLPPLKGRGPDDEGIYVDQTGNFGLGHRRLSIIDLSENAHQPMIDSKLGLSIVYDGEIYNYQELREQLLAIGYTFYSNSDTEVLLKAYHAWGYSFVKRLNGMFAFCIHDQQRGRFLLGRDRLGIKPLYYTNTSEGFFFASNIQSLLATGQVDTTLSSEALHYYLSFHAVVPAPLTIFEKVKKLDSGTLMTIQRDGSSSFFRYWNIDFQRDVAYAHVSENEWEDLIVEGLFKAVKRGMVSDVPVGALLSGGLDSSLIVALMAKLEPDSLHTYSIGFEDVEQEEGNEFYYSDLIAQTFETNHQKIFIDSNRLLPNIVNAIGVMAEPMVSHDAVAFYLLSEEISKETKVVLSGQGADEIFAGYHWYPKVMNGTGNTLIDYQNAFFDRTHEEVLDTLHEQYKQKVMKNYSEDFILQHFSHPGADEPVDRALRLDTTVMLIDDPVKRVDNMTMAWGLEGRVPFLDHELVELAAKIPPNLKIKNGGKYILKKVAERILPHEVIYRKKGYFPVPAVKYLQGEYRDLVRDILRSDKARQRNLYNENYINRLIEKPDQHMTVLGGNKLWQLTVLELWLQQMGC